MIPADDADHHRHQMHGNQRQQEAEDCVELIKHSIGRLPVEQRDAFLLHREADLSLQQIAEVMAVAGGRSGAISRTSALSRGTKAEAFPAVLTTRFIRSTYSL